MPDEPLPKFNSPPVVETVLGVQFAPLRNFTGALAGWFWKSRLGPEWAKTRDTVPISDAFERFDYDGGWVSSNQLQLVSTEAVRTQLIRADDERMIQIQFSRFILNWKKVANHYPSYNALLPEFMKLFSSFADFAREVGYDPPALNQWELTYVNNLEKGELWSSFDDLGNIFSNFDIPKTVAPIKMSDTLNANWRYILGENAGRLHVGLNHVRNLPDNREALRLQLVARGPLSSSESSSLRTSFDLGHEAIVRTFAAITSERAHVFWKRTQ